MYVSSELPLPTESVPSAVFAGAAPQCEERFVEDEEFPADLPLHHDWMLQPVSRRASRPLRGGAILLLAVVLVLISVVVAHSL